MSLFSDIAYTFASFSLTRCGIFEAQAGNDQEYLDIQVILTIPKHRNINLSPTIARPLIKTAHPFPFPISTLEQFKIQCLGAAKRHKGVVEYIYIYD